MRKYLLKTINLRGHQNVCGYILIGLSFMVLTLLSVKTLAPEIRTDAATETLTVGPYQLSMAVDASTSISITPTDQQKIATGTNNISITNTCSAGATVTMKAKTTETALTPTSTNSGGVNKTIAATTSSSLSDNAWGFSTNSGSTYYAIPASTATPASIYNEMTAQTAAKTIPVTFGVKIDSSIPSGTYTNDIVYTMAAKDGCLAYTVNWDMNSGTKNATGTYPSRLWVSKRDVQNLSSKCC